MRMQNEEKCEHSQFCIRILRSKFLWPVRKAIVSSPLATPPQTSLLPRTTIAPPAESRHGTSRTRNRSAEESSPRSATVVRSSRSSHLVDRDRHDLVAALGMVGHAAHPLGHAREDRVAAVEVWLRRVRDEELRAAGVGAGE